MANGENRLTESVTSQLMDIVGDNNLILSGDQLVDYGKDWTTRFPPMPSAVAFPRTTDQVKDIVLLANQYNLGVTPSGGRTGLSAGAVATAGEIVISLEKMNKILCFEPLDRQLHCQAGVVTANIHRAAEEHGLMYPVDFASSGSSQIGGNVSTNAGGIKVLRYGMTRDWIKGMTVVTGAGEVLCLGRGLVKNNAGYDLKQLFVGSEGTLGIITEVIISLTNQPSKLGVMVLGTNEFVAVMSVFQLCREKLTVTAFEYFSQQALNKVVAHRDLPRPLQQETEHYMLVEFERDDETPAVDLFTQCVTNNWVIDGVISQSDRQAQALWQLREGISEAISIYTPYKNDISVRPSQVAGFIVALEQLVAEHYPAFDIVWFGHIGDGNMHLNILKPHDLDQENFYQCCEKVSDLVFDLVRSYGGSISAEHGIGLLKKHYFANYADESELVLMKSIKKLFDPKGVLNPGKVLAD